MLSRSVSLPVVILSALVGVIGCGSGGSGQLPVVKVKGTVYLDEKPHGAGVVTLTPTGAGEGKDPRPVIGGTIKDDGTYTLTTYNTGDGAPVGEYSAVLGKGTEASAGSTDPAEMMAMMGGGGKDQTDTIKVTIPEGGSTSLDLNFSTVKKANKSQPQNAPLGASSSN